MVVIYLAEKIENCGSAKEMLPSCLDENMYFSGSVNMNMWALYKKLDKEIDLKKKSNKIIAFLHGSNPEANDKVEWPGKPYDNTLPPLIARLSLLICQDGGRVVMFSGGEAGCDEQAWEELLTKHGFERGHQFDTFGRADIPKYHSIYDANDIKKDWRVDELKPCFPYNLLALSILCQGVLILHSDAKCISNCVGGDKQDFGIGLSDERKNELRDETLVNGWWQEIFSSSSDLTTLLKQEWNRTSKEKEVGWEAVSKLATWIQYSTSDKDPDTRIDLKTVADAYEAISRLF